MQSYPVEQISILDVSGTNLSEIRGVKDAFALIWKQTVPLFVPPHLLNMVLLCTSTFALFFVCHGAHMWYPQILDFYSDNIGKRITTCEAISIGHAKALSNVTSTTDM